MADATHGFVHAVVVVEIGGERGELGGTGRRAFVVGQAAHGLTDATVPVDEIRCAEEGVPLLQLFDPCHQHNSRADSRADLGTVGTIHAADTSRHPVKDGCTLVDAGVEVVAELGTARSSEADPSHSASSGHGSWKRWKNDHAASLALMSKVV